MQHPDITNIERFGYAQQENCIGFCAECGQAITEDFMEQDGKMYCEECAEYCQCGKVIPNGKYFCEECLKKECTFENAFKVSEAVFKKDSGKPTKVNVNEFISYLIQACGFDVNQAVYEYAKQNLTDLPAYAEEFIKDGLDWYKENKES